jgi:NAD(P)-dependent dehydrogenase (short-subunit alcohol dehydrogenase family)
MNKSLNFLVLGGTGSIGSACVKKLQKNATVYSGNRDLAEFEKQIKEISGFDGIVWAQGMNAADSVKDFSVQTFEEVMEANVTYILTSLKILLENGKINRDSQLVVISSVWSQLSRPNKISYGVSKAALGGLVRSLSVELGPQGIQINALLPGPVETPMTNINLRPEELVRIISETPIKRLVTLDEVVEVACGMATGNLRGVTGQEIIIDGGWSVSKLV